MSKCIKCDKKAIARFLCRSHYNESHAAGTLADFVGAKELRTPQDRLLEKVKKTDAGCWEWQSHRNDYGYGLIWINRKFERAHRISYGLFCGEVKADDVICHRCDNPPCVNPEHLFLGTRLDNNRDARAKGRTQMGEKHWNTKMTKEQILAIRGDSRVNTVIGKEFGISPGTVSRIKTRARWGHLT